MFRGSVLSRAQSVPCRRFEQERGGAGLHYRPEDGSEDPGALGASGIPAIEAAGTSEAGSFHPDHRSDSRGGPGATKKQRYTATRIFERRRDEHGFTGKLTIVTDSVREKKRRTKEVFLPLAHPPGHAQVHAPRASLRDVDEARVEIGGVVRKIRYFALALPHSDAFS